MSIKSEVETLKHKAVKIKDKLEELSAEPENYGDTSSLNHHLDSLIELLGLTPGPEFFITDNNTD
jgi:hypothetical protein